MKDIARTLSLAALLGVHTLAGAGTPASPGATDAPREARMHHPDPARMTEHMSAMLGLSAEQTGAVQQINERFAAKMEEQRKQREAMRAAHREQMRGLRDQRDQELKKVLTEEQYARHLAQREAMHDQHGGHRRHGHGPGATPPAAPEAAPPAAAQ